MNCEIFQTVAADLARNHVMEASERASAQAHVEECSSCRKSLGDQHELSEKLRIVTEQMKSAQAPQHLEARVLAAFREQTRVQSIQSRTRRGYWLAAAAAILVMVLGLLAWRWQVASVRQTPVLASSNDAAGQKPDTTKPNTTQPDQPPVAAGDKEPSRNSPRKKLWPRLHRPFSQLAKSTAAKQPTVEPAAILSTDDEAREVATAFVPIGYGSASDLQYGGQLVRVELPRSVLARFGLPMNMDRVDERVKADVLVGSDGFARAIRFVKRSESNQTDGGLRPANERN